MTDLQIKIAQEIIIEDFLAKCQEKGMTYEESKKAVMNNMQHIASMVEGLIKSNI